MRPITLSIHIVLAAGLLLTGCSSSPYADKCAVACTVPTTGPCATQSASSCQTTCNAMTDGLSATCAQCLVEHSGWTGVECDGSSHDCPKAFGPGETTSVGGSSSCTCSAADEKCNGFRMARTTDEDCAVACGAATDGGSSSSSTTTNTGTSSGGGSGG